MKNLHPALFIPCVSLLSLLFASAALAAPLEMPEDYKGESPAAPAGLHDGFYLGIAGGADNYKAYTGMSIAPVFATGDTVTQNFSKSIFSSGGAAGGFLGYGRYFEGFHNTYLGLEIFGNYSWASKNDYEKFSNVVGVHDIPDHITGTYYTMQTVNTHIRAKSNFGVSLLPGVKLNNRFLLYLRLGYNWANMQVSQEIYNTTSFENDIGVVTPNGDVTASYSTAKTIGGYSYGIGLEGQAYNNLSLRVDFAHTQYNSFYTNGTSAHIRPEDNQVMFGINYHV